MTTIAIRGKSNENSVAVVFQKFSSMSIAALIADIRNFNLASFINTALNVDITDIPILGTLTIPELGFAAATAEITSDLLPMLYTPGSRLEAFGTTLPSGVSAYLTVDIAGVSINAAYSLNKLSFTVPPTSSLSVKQLLDQVPNLSGLNSLPQVVVDVLNTKVSGFNFDPQSKQLDLHIRFWDTKCSSVQTRYVTSFFMGHATANDLLEKMTECLNRNSNNEICQQVVNKLDTFFSGEKLYNKIKEHST